MDKVMLKNDAVTEKKKADMMHRLFNKNQNTTFVDTGTQTGNYDNYFVFSTLLHLIMDEDPTLKDFVITENKYMDLFWKFFEF